MQAGDLPKQKAKKAKINETKRKGKRTRASLK
jgi:hypothetical protein